MGHHVQRLLRRRIGGAGPAAEVRVRAHGDQGPRTGTGAGGGIVHDEIDAPLERADEAVAVDRHRDPVLVEPEVREVDGGPGVERIEVPGAGGIAGLGHPDQDLPGTGRDRLHHRDPPVVVRVVDGAGIGEGQPLGRRHHRGPEGRGSHRADDRPRRLVEDPVVVVEAAHDPVRPHRAPDVGGDHDVARVGHGDVVQALEARGGNRGRSQGNPGHGEEPALRCGGKVGLGGRLEFPRHPGADGPVPGRTPRRLLGQLAEVHHRRGLGGDRGRLGDRARRRHVERQLVGLLFFPGVGLGPPQEGAGHE